ncbi:aldehyde dehydrogenase family protein [Accumulibacter sp.]|uniref:aldehyde dehydrogenase family protein n=1 Tax=Accumulibacter sp. TaxID=2053492 RepID=UPI00260E0EDA|nr:aldehyde dehydrogenase family protein [Accumulibacter sp.]
MTDIDEILAIPLWINGHAYLTMAPTFFDVCDPRTGRVRRRTPLCGAAEARAAADSAGAALAIWSALAAEQRAALLTRLGDALKGYAPHFAGLIGEECGKDDMLAATEVDEAVNRLRSAGECRATEDDHGVVAIVSDATAPLLGAVRWAVPALLAGAVVILKPSPQAPSALFALAELSARSGFPGGVFNVLQGDLEAIEGLCAAAPVNVLRFAGEPMLGARVAAIAARHGKPFRD